ncbi:hypothetical protein SAMD00019534_096810, partial [Acytostelium subglobosum LB1]|uniref:hypothetical protein n=1 Tax=Acytostelium subglobosum LB1 TaxID=1410327 RepID=UPI00064486CB
MLSQEILYCNINDNVTIAYRTNKILDVEAQVGHSDNVDGDSNNKDINYNDIDKENKSCPILFLHGMASTSYTWLLLADSIVRKHSNRRVIIPDLRGHGKSSRSNAVADYSIDSFIGDTFSLMDRLNINRFDIVGHSLGGLIALGMATSQPGRIRRLILEDTPSKPLLEPEQEVKAAPLSIMSILSSMGIIRTILVALWRGFDYKMSNYVINQIRTPTPEWWDSLANITAHTLLLGATDSHVSPKRQEAMAARIARSNLKIFIGGHHLHRDQPDEFEAAVVSFLFRDIDPNKDSSSNSRKQRISIQLHNNDIHVPSTKL